MENQFTLILCKRAGYSAAWSWMYKHDKKIFNQNMYDGVNPALNKKPLDTEFDNFCTIAVDTNINIENDPVIYENERNESIKVIYKPIGLFSMVCTKDSRTGKTKTIGKQFVVNSDYHRRGIGKAMLLTLEKVIQEYVGDWYYIGCSSMSSKIMESLNRKPYKSDVEHDLYKYEIHFNDEDKTFMNEQLQKYVINNVSTIEETEFINS